MGRSVTLWIVIVAIASIGAGMLHQFIFNKQVEHVIEKFNHRSSSDIGNCEITFEEDFIVATQDKCPVAISMAFTMFVKYPTSHGDIAQTIQDLLEISFSKLVSFQIKDDATIDEVKKCIESGANKHGYLHDIKIIAIEFL